MLDIVLDIVVTLVYGYIALLLIQRMLETKDVSYSIKNIENGRVFSFTLGVYAGKLRLIRAPYCVKPMFIRHVYGWEIVFPTGFTDKDVDEFLLNNDPPLQGNTSHSVDVKIYREVMIHRNCGLFCVAGKICTKAA